MPVSVAAPMSVVRGVVRAEMRENWPAPSSIDTT